MPRVAPSAHNKEEDSMSFSSIDEAIEAIEAGEMVIVVDDENRENEGDLVVAAEKITAEHIAFMMKYARGLICVPLPAERLDKLEIPLMVTRNSDSLQTAFTVSVDCKHGTTTGISAEDRAATVKSLIDPQTRPEDLSRPGHIFPLRANRLGVLGRPGHTEAAVDLARLAGLAPAGVICEIANDDGTMSRLPDLEKFAIEHGLHIVTIDALIEYCRSRDTRVKRYAQSFMPTRFGDFKAIAYRDSLTGTEHLALTLGELCEKEDVLVRVHSECLTGEAFRSMRCDCGQQLEMALRAVQLAGAGCVIYMRGQEGRGIGLGNKIAAYSLQDHGRDTLEANRELGFASDSREYNAAADIIRDLGIGSVRLLTNNPTKIEALRTSGVIVSSRQSLIAASSASNITYLKTKRDRFGHLLDQDTSAEHVGRNNVFSVFGAQVFSGPLG
ncbi:bifunctional 3,4-dihydroxy-2-butanone-4-phosphate synthase/GTP cyclohydrolase II [Rhizobium hidalgonense]|uniref:Riboflavin biosynthesis protein RibBA n=2 Tax=Rhizobium/Agrobacterium group TaxID=227290 RepID=A0ABX4JHJ8_9HYPH|nr:bifunctional 3,4-dihydroxy-2-butanone-4-phosphate synthase/GTP cyclohydrolase II [Rhizobium phaseoli]PDS94625.1 bifunctional 3,4-dihydroxy-2-butanone-4-phosphate synthase/GTP cyclohydrolase II [Rhizobium sp. S9]PDT18974.1 bifunctional 3,4-dihydroxy-2-butanone-4-phosphate synthase/GTP cyclohydrolase II [Rhizobium hidalgonense]PDS69105.1 bifunctional 3,4-dihydroxy-2-butanone-4-phosphate synthase/GTP cyclohydrolase II [Rhizobium phaseoli]PON01994.1 bifunctional 3,4-dihydroxy-2-butanone 4-phosph